MRIDNDTHSLLSDAEKAEFDLWGDLLESKGYAMLVQFLEGQGGSIQSVIDNPNSWDEHVYARGQRDALNWVLNLEAILEARIAEKSIEADVVEFDTAIGMEL
jgi:hypothetical protein